MKKTFLAVVLMTSMSSIMIQAQTSVKEKIELTQRSELFQVHITEDASPDKFIVTIDNPLKEKLRLTVTGGNGHYDCTVKNETTRKRFDMSLAEDGVYTIEVTGKNQHWQKEIRMETVADLRKILLRL